MKNIKVTDYKKAPIESALERSLRHNDLELGSPMVSMDINAFDEPLVFREEVRGDFTAKYRRWVNDDFLKGMSKVSAKTLFRNLSDPSQYEEQVKLENGDADLYIDMMFSRGKLVSLTDITPQVLSQAIKDFYGIHVPDETFAAYNPSEQSKESSQRERRIERAVARVGEIASEKIKLPQEQRGTLQEAVETAAREENIPARVLYHALQPGEGVSGAVLKYAVIDAFEVRQPFLDFLANSGIKVKSSDIVSMFVNYMAKTIK
ncbi:hypothetical protein HYV80_00300 [Candidatus Woesearchaeota archaeon]|nr:hypothetical protein [Candidatus Woesearchaeota archaeon]